MADRVYKLPTYEHLRAVEKAMCRRRGFRQAFDEITFVDAPDWDPDEDWHPVQREVLEAIAAAVLEVEALPDERNAEQ